MKDYTEVVKSRYDGTDANLSLEDNQYSLFNPVGLASKLSCDYVSNKIIHYAISNTNKNLRALKILDIGCGKGYVTRSFCEFTQEPANIYGVDYSEKRVEICKKMNGGINYVQADMVNDDYFEPLKFDIITAFDVFMHLAKREDIIKSLSKIGNKLTEQGLFIWYDTIAKDHFINSDEADHKGFSVQQMDELALSEGLEFCIGFGVNKMILGRYHSIYLNKSLPEILVRIITRLYPGKPGNLVRIYRKKGN